MYAVSQGAMAAECRADDTTTLNLLSKLHDRDTLLQCVAERAFLKTLVCTKDISNMQAMYALLN